MDQFPEAERLPRLFRLTVLDMREETERDWESDAACATTDPELFFPEKGGSTKSAKGICAGCDVRARCLQYAMDRNEQYGIWGGLSERERHALRVGRKMSTGSRMWEHGTTTGYQHGCHDEDVCPGDPETGVSCAQARREYARDRYLRRTAS